MYYTLTTDPHGSVLTAVLSDGQSIIIDDDDPGFHSLAGYILEHDAAEIDEDVVRRLAHTPEAIVQRIENVSERVSLAGNTLLFDGDPIDNSLSRTIVSMAAADRDGAFEALVNFLEKVQTNPSEESREHLYSFIQRYDVRILPSGNITLYKGVMLGADNESLSISSGTAYVDGEKVSGNIPNPTGAVITMPRASVDQDRLVGCSTGLHAGTWAYASSFARGRVVLVEINPRDVVSVPEDCEFQKVRVSRYTVLEEIDHEIDIAAEYDELFPHDDEYGDNDFYTEWDDEDAAWDEVYGAAEIDAGRIVEPYLSYDAVVNGAVLGQLGVSSLGQYVNRVAGEFIETQLSSPEDYTTHALRVYVLNDFATRLGFTK